MVYRTIAAAAVMVVILAAATNIRGDQDIPDELFRKIFYTLEKTMGISVNPGKINVKLISGKVTMPSIVLEHSVQGKWAVIKNAQFPLGLMFGTVKPAGATVQVERLDVKIDLGKGKFWNSSTADGKPIPGSPNLVVGKMNFESVNVTLKHGKSHSLQIKDARATISKVNIPATAWSRGDAPIGVWARATMEGGRIFIEGWNGQADLEKLDVKFNSEILTLGKLLVSLPGRGRIALAGKVDCIGAEPSRYDLSISMEEFKLFPESPESTECTASGKLKLKGKKGKLKITGELKADGIMNRQWKYKNCASEVKLDIAVVDTGKEKKKTGSISGSICGGKVALN